MDSRLLSKLVKKTKKIPIHPTFIILFLWFVITKDFLSFLIFITVVLSHELGHYFIAKKLGYKLDSFFIAPYGVSLNYKEKTFDSRDEILIALAGPLVNISLSLIMVSLWWAIPEFYNYSDIFVKQSFMLGIYNLLPCYPLDGGRIMVGLLQNYTSRDRAVKLISKFNFIFSILLLIAFFVTLFIDFNPSLCLCGSFLLLGMIDSKYESKYQPTILFKKKNKDFSKTIFLTVNGKSSLAKLIRHIEINRFTVFVVNFQNGKTIMLDENKIKTLSFKYPLNLSLEEIFTQDKE